MKMTQNESNFTKIARAVNGSRKAIAALAIGVLGWGQQVVRSEPLPITGDEWIALGFATLAAFGVYGITNKNDTAG
jgi:hypothetical protein